MSFFSALYRAYREKPTRHLIGLMSGTSADAIDAALVKIAGTGDSVSVRTLAYQETPLHGLREAILSAGVANAETLCLLSVAVGQAFAEAAIAMAEIAGVSPDEIDAIGSHGQTVWHAPDPSARWNRIVAGSLQIGDPATIAEQTGVLVVSDFRAADLAAGGQGAPLVPLVDGLLMRLPGENRAVQNIGGIANVACIIGSGGLDDVIGFDVGPGNMVIDALASIATNGAQDRDADGEIASEGRVRDNWLEILLRHPYLEREPPKSTGRELFGRAFAERVWKEGREKRFSAEDILATAVALTAESIARAYRRFLPPLDEAIIGGGGARNPALMRELKRRLAPLPVLTHEEIGMNGDAKEAVAFAVLADRTLQGLPGNLPQVTGASRKAILGTVAFPRLSERSL